MSFIIASLAAVAPSVPISNAESPAVIVERLLEASAREDWAAVLAMLTVDAQLGMGDVGGLLNEETVAVLGILEKYGCRIISVHETAKPDSVQPELRFVEVKRLCPYGAKSGRSGEHEIVVTYFVKEQKIAGFYMDMEMAPALPK